MNLFEKIKKRIGYYKVSHSYKVKLSDITIPPDFVKTPPKFVKMVAKREYFRAFGKYESKVILTNDFVLVDGYTTYLLCAENGNKYIEVYFID